MKKYSWLFLILVTTGCFADVSEEPMQDEIDTLITDNQSPDVYDKPYNLNPVPINPRTPEPSTWKDAYNRLCDQIREINTRIDLIQSRVRTLEDMNNTTDSEGDEG